MRIKNKEISSNHPTFVIAEAGVNYNNKLSLAFKMIDTAKKAGADAIKFQTFKAKNIILSNSVKPKYQNNLKEKNYFKIIKKLEPSFRDQKKIFDYCNKKKIIFLSTPYDDESVDFLDSIDISAFKISSSDLTNHPFLEYIATKKKPIILSTGLSTLTNVDDAVKLFFKRRLKNKLAILQATSDYPTPNYDVNLRVISSFKNRYKIPIGLSDHTQNNIASLGALVLGACILEKHFTLSRTLPGPDQTSSIEPNELFQWIKEIRIMEQSLGTTEKFITKSEKRNLTMRKIIVLKPVKKGQKITKNLILTLRGNRNGILPLNSNLKKIIGKTVKRNITNPSQFSWKMIV
jgi:N-acetylneuraminate synthase/N,N'-diacetyllegionaminate synthase